MYVPIKAAIVSIRLSISLYSESETYIIFTIMIHFPSVNLSMVVLKYYSSFVVS